MLAAIYIYMGYKRSRRSWLFITSLCPVFASRPPRNPVFSYCYICRVHRGYPLPRPLTPRCQLAGGLRECSIKVTGNGTQFLSWLVATHHVQAPAIPRPLWPRHQSVAVSQTYLHCPRVNVAVRICVETLRGSSGGGDYG